MTTPRPDSKTAVEGAAAPALTTAVIVASGPLLAHGGNQVRIEDGAHPVSALTPVGGLSLFQRAVLTLQRAGIIRMHVLVDQHEKALRAGVSADPRITALVRWIPIREFPPHDPRTWEALADDLHGVCLIVSAHAVFSRGLVKRLCEEVNDGRSVLTVAYSAADGSTDMLVLPVTILRGSLRTPAASPDEHPLRAMLAQASAGGSLRTIETTSRSIWYRPVRRDTDITAAEDVLFQSLTSELDGVVDRYFNRPLSRPLTRLFLWLGWSPNAITILSILTGLTAALSFSWGTYLAGVIGALLFQASAIVDCCDGDVARLTFKESRFGAQLDLYGDNAVHMVLFAAIAWARHVGTQAFAPLGLAAAAILGNALSLWFVTRLQARPAQPLSADRVYRTRSEFILKHLANRDFSVVVLVFALLNSLGLFLWLAAIGSNIFWIYTAWVTRSPARC